MNQLRIGLTGGISSGKSSVSQLFKQHQITLIDADQIARDLFAPNAPLLTSLKNKFGDDIFFSNGELDRKKLGKIVFNSKEDLAWLNRLTHPKVAENIEQQLAAAISPYVILDIPLLIDKSGQVPAHLANFIDRILVVDVTEENQINRLCARDNLSKADAQSIIANQSTRKQKLALADDIIDNNGDFNQLETQVEQLHNYYLTLSDN
ncbi:dephospho-CoA kinase [Aliikangiella sp. IMCC44359]|uniref:dephospho-CoA kinase n=1 Tax=Aliikangiella sp. IMCC44359 TaxID=3459125 RepID=UPI00403B1FE8